MADISADDLASQRAKLFDATSGGDQPETQEAVFAYEAPVRIWHWLNALCILVLCITGYLIGSPPASVGGEASSHYTFGTIRFLHFAAAQIFAFAFIGRFIFAFIGNSTARELFHIPFTSADWWDDFWATAKWYLFMQDKPKRFIGHNPVAQVAMFCGFVLPAVFMILTGVALYMEAYGESYFLHWVTDIVFWFTGGSQQTHTLHHLMMWAIICFVILHIYIAIREEIVSRQSMISTMISGWRMFKK